MSRPGSDDSPAGFGFLTLTHARLRAAQGDARGARRILEAILEARPDDAAARALLDGLPAVEDMPPPAETAEQASAPRVAAESSELRERFQDILGRGGEAEKRRIVRRLRGVLAGIERIRRKVDDSR